MKAKVVLYCIIVGLAALAMCFFPARPQIGIIALLLIGLVVTWPSIKGLWP